MSSRPYRLGKRAEDAAATRQRILDAGWAEIELAGYRPASIEAIAARAGVTARDGLPAFRVAWGTVRSDRLGAGRTRPARPARRSPLHPDVVEGTRLFLRENCALFYQVGPILRAMLEVEREEPEIAAVLAITYRGRRLDSLRELSERIAASDQLARGWTVGDVYDALTIITGIEAFEDLIRDHNRTADDASEALFKMTRAFFAPGNHAARPRRAPTGSA